MAGEQPAMSADMAHEMGHSGTDLPAMVRDMRNRFWISPSPCPSFSTHRWDFLLRRRHRLI
jgi:hypothetical protein